MGRTLRVLVILVALLLLWVPLWAQPSGRQVLTSPDGTREVQVSPGQAIYVTCPDGTCTGGGGVAAAIDLTKIGGVVLGGADVIDVPNTAFRVNCVVGCSASSFTDNSAFTFGTTSINIAGYVFDDVAPNAVTENRAAAPRMSGNRIPYSILRDAAGNERGANVTAANELKVTIGDLVGTQGAVTIHRDSLQIGGAASAGAQWQQVPVLGADPLVTDVGLLVRDVQEVASDGVIGSAAPLRGKFIVGRDPVTNAIRQVEVFTSAPAGTEGGVITRNIPSGTQAISAAALPLPTGAATAALQTQPGVDIGDVTVNNGAGAAAVNVQDGGNSLTIDAASLPLPTGAATEATQLLQATAAKQSDGSQKTQIVDAAGNVVATATAAPAPGTRGLVGWVSQGGPWTADVTGNVAHGVADIGSPVKIGCRARGTVAAVAGDARVDLYCDTFGRPQVTNVPTYTPQTANAPATFSVGVASAQALAANASRKGVIIVNVSAAKVCLGIAAAAVIDSGICLQPDASLSLLNGSFDGVPQGAINAIASAAASSISIQEFQ